MATTTKPKLSQTQILQKLGITVTPQLKLELSGNGRLQQYLNQRAALKGLPEPFNPSFAEALIQDLLPLAAQFGPAIGGAGGAAGGAGAAAEGGTAEGAAAGGAAGGAASAAKTVLSNVPKALTALSVGALFSNIGLWKGVGMVIAGGILILIGILNLAGVDAGGIGRTARRVIP